tara:strand:- start:5062 stop:5508 length:447 start_codon:yes stop_codon:yes gene_type:complete
MTPPPIEFNDTLLLWAGFAVSVIAALTVKEYAESIVKGLKFKADKSFNQGDVVFIDGAKATIMSIGIGKTVFAIVDCRGLVLRHVPNTKIEGLKLEKVVSEDIHMDSVDEKAQAVIDLIQDRQDKIDREQSHHISKNAIEIEELKNGK